MKNAAGRRLNTTRWSLAQALAWVLSRDVAFVETLASDRDPPLTHTHLIVRVHVAGFSGSFEEAEHELIKSITNSEVVAEGEPGLTFESRMDRQVIGARAYGAQIEDGSKENSQAWLLEPQGEQQSRWYSIEVDTETLCRCFPTRGATTLRRTSGRPEKFDWVAIRAHVFSQLEHHGMPSCIDPVWSTNAAVEQSALVFCRQTFDQEPASSTIRRRVSVWLSEYEISARN